MNGPDFPSPIRRGEELLAAGPAVPKHGDLRARIRAANAVVKRRIVVLDDDPTGSQSVQGIPELTRWEDEDLRWAFDQPTDGFFILTNTRGLNEDEARATVLDVARAVRRVSDQLGVSCSLIARGDSTLRGHYPMETDALIELAAASGAPYDALLLAPAYLAAGRVTSGDVQYVRDGESYVPVGLTNYARDATFGFRSSNIRHYVEEKTHAAIAADDVQSLSLEDIRVGGVERVRDVLLGCRNAVPVIVNAVDDSDLDVVVLGLIEAEKAGVRVLSRTGPSFVAARLGLASRPPLRHSEIYPNGERPGHGLVIVGSHVELTTRQVDRLVSEVPDLAIVELAVPLLLDATQARAELDRCGAALISALEQADTMLVTSREQIVGETGHSSLLIAQMVSAALSALTARAVREVPLTWVVAKGGITSSDVATEGLSIRRATVVGQLFPGIVSVWVHEGGNGTSLDGLPYVVFAGNVGDESTLASAVRIMRGELR